MAFRQVFRRKDLRALLAAEEKSTLHLRRVLGPVHLVMLGIGGIVGAGIFALVGTAAAGHTGPNGEIIRLGAGPAIAVSFMLTGIACVFTGLCYAEFASLVPISGSAYTYAYASLGELVAWIIGWDLILEYAVGNIAVAVSWSGYFCELLRTFGIEIPPYLAHNIDYVLRPEHSDILLAAPKVFGVPIVFNLPAVLIVAAITAILVIGVRESAWFNAVMVGLKLLVLAFFVGVGFLYMNPENWQPFAPNGWKGIQAGAAMVFFAFIGFDAVSTTAEECRNPKRDMPIGILGSLGICTLIYIVVAVVLTGMVPWEDLDVPEPLSLAMNVVNLRWAAAIVAFGSVVAQAAVLMVYQLGQPRILMAMSRDGLLPPLLGRVHPRYQTPHVATIATGVFVAVGAAFYSLEDMADLCSIGTLSAFLIVCVGIPVLRRREPDRPRSFRTPWVPVVPILGALACLYLMLGLPFAAWRRFGIWLLVGLAFYFLYGYWKSAARAAQRDEG